jgi:hypothetical protein
MWIDLWWYLIDSEHKYVFLFFCFVCLHVCLYVSNHFNHCIKLLAPCGNKKVLFLFGFYLLEFLILFFFHSDFHFKYFDLDI